MHLVHLASRIYGTPLLMARDKLDVILGVLGPRFGLRELGQASVVPEVGRRVEGQAPVAVIPVYGTLVRRSMGLEAASGLTSYGEIGAQLKAALADSSVRGILLDIDSSGGEAGGVFELAAQIRAANSIKPVWAHANESAFSAAYALAAGASRLTVSATSGVGSIGVIALHLDQSQRDAQEGLAYTAIYAGHHKNDFSPHAPLTAEAAASLQAEVDRLYNIFVQQVAQLRGLDPARVRGTEAGLFFGDTALSAGLADALRTSDEVLAEFTKALRPPLLSTHLSTHLSTQRLSASTPSSTTLESSMQNPVTPVVAEPPLTVNPETPSATPVASVPSAVQTIPTAVPANPAAPPLADTNQGRSEAQAIAELCLLAGCPERTATYLASNVSEASVRRTLLNERADQPDIRSQIAITAGTSVDPNSSPLIAAVKRRITKD